MGYLPGEALVVQPLSGNHIRQPVRLVTKTAEDAASWPGCAPLASPYSVLRLFTPATGCSSHHPDGILRGPRRERGHTEADRRALRPAQVVGGEPGSPKIALNAALTHQHDMSKRQLLYLFIESDRDRYLHLKSLVVGLAVPEHVQIFVEHGEFADHMEKVLGNLNGATLAPAFIMIDPFGVKGIPFPLVAQLAAFKKTELLISFMYEPMTRWLGSVEFGPHLDALFGCNTWQDAKKMIGSERKTFLLDLYGQRLRAAGMEYVRSFEMRDAGGRTEYYLVYATHHLDGIKAMKAAMWAVDSTGSYRFSDTTNPAQATLFGLNPDYDELGRLMSERFRGSTVGIEAIERYVVVETPFRETHYKKQILKVLEQQNQLSVQTSRKRAYSYPLGTKVSFSADVKWGNSSQ